ncbi:MAG: nucleotidyltransferase family protein [Brevinematia bacterium]
MQREDILKISKEIITEELEKAGYNVLEIILFGSRARGDESPDSDWDFYVVVDKDIDFKSKKNIIVSIRRKMALNKIPNDILIQSKNESEKRKINPGYVSYNVFKEGMRI